MADVTAPEPPIHLSDSEMAGLADAAAGLVAVRVQSDAAMIDLLGVDYQVTLPNARKNNQRVELTAEQIDEVPVKGRLESLTPETAFSRFGLETTEPSRLRVKPADARRFEVGGVVSGGGLDGFLYVVAAPTMNRVAGTVASVDVLLDVQPVRRNG